MMPRKLRPPKERSEQRAFVRWFYLQYPNERLAKIPNDLVRGETQAITMSLEGLLGGMPDIFILAARKPYHGLLIEFKRVKGGITSNSQTAIIEHLNKVGYFAIVCKGWIEAMDATKEYMRGESWTS